MMQSKSGAHGTPFGAAAEWLWLWPLQTPTTNAESYERLAEDPAKAKVTVRRGPVLRILLRSRHFACLVSNPKLHACAF
jgi:hypothetical protein